MVAEELILYSLIKIIGLHVPVSEADAHHILKLQTLINEYHDSCSLSNNFDVNIFMTENIDTIFHRMNKYSLITNSYCYLNNIDLIAALSGETFNIEFFNEALIMCNDLKCDTSLDNFQLMGENPLISLKYA